MAKLTKACYICGILFYPKETNCNNCGRKLTKRLYVDSKLEIRQCVYCGDDFYRDDGRLCCETCSQSELIADTRFEAWCNGTRTPKKIKDPIGLNTRTS